MEIKEGMSIDEIQELLKANEQMVLEKAKKQVKQEELVKNTTELFKSYDFVDQEDVTLLVKAITTVDGTTGKALFKAFDMMDEKLRKKDEEMELIKSMFGTKEEAIVGTPSHNKVLAANSAEQRTQELEEIVKSKLKERK